MLPGPPPNDSASNLLADSLSRGVLIFTSWVLAVAGFALAALVSAEAPESQLRIALNVAVGVLGLTTLLVARTQRYLLAGHLIVWGMWIIVAMLVWNTDAGRSPSWMNYPVLVVLTGWLLGTRATLVLASATVTLLLAQYLINPFPPPASPAEARSFTHVVFVMALIILTTGLTLLSRRSYERHLAAVQRTSLELADRDAELQKVSQAVKQSTDSVVITDLTPRIEYVNDAFELNTGYTREEVLGRNPNLLHSGKTPPAVHKDMWSALKRGQAWQGEFRNRRKDGSEFVELARITPVRQADGRITHYVAVKQDVTRIRLVESEIQRLTHFDQLTGLPNRALLMTRLDQCLTAARRQHRLDAIILFNIDRFKYVNDAGGHTLGDSVLVTISQRIRDLLGPEDTLARLSADEFAILLHGSSPQRDAVSGRALSLANAIHTSLRQPTNYGSVNDLWISASMGVALFPHSDVDSAHEVLRRADTALHRAKSSGGAQTTFFDAEMGAVAAQRFRAEHELRRGVPGGELRLFLQPQVDAQGCLVGAEALVRWQHPQRGLLAPAEFISVAEASDQIVEIDEWVTEQACQLLAMHGAPATLSVNISPRHFRLPRFVPWLLELVARHGVQPGRLVLEVTENLLIEDVDAVITKMNILTAHGILFSIDDFGTGYSSLSYLKRLPIHELKIDKSFVQDATGGESDAMLVETILAVARHLRLKVVAEGVETQEQADFLNQRGTVVHQGYLFGRPEDAAVWMDRWRSALPTTTGTPEETA